MSHSLNNFESRASGKEKIYNNKLPVISSLDCFAGRSGSGGDRDHLGVGKLRQGWYKRFPNGIVFYEDGDERHRVTCRVHR